MKIRPWLLACVGLTAFGLLACDSGASVMTDFRLMEVYLMMPFRLSPLPACNLARGAPGAICAAFFLCSSAAWAQTRATSEQLARSVAQIETVGFMNRMQMGVGGIFLAKPKPVALFRSGDALLEIGNLSRATSVEADRAAHTKDWGRWKRTAGGVEVLHGGKWKKLDYPKTMERLPAGFALSGDYGSLTGAGNAAVGGSNVLVAENRYSFRPDGTYSSNRLRSFSNPNVITTTKGPALEGHYRVDGYLLRLEPPVGPPETHVIATYPTDPSVLWIDGRGYTRAH